MRKIGAIIGLIFSSLALIVSCAYFSMLMASDSITDVSFGFMKISYENADEYSIGNAELDNNITALDIEWLSDLVTVKPYTGNSIKVSEESESTLENDDMLRYRVNNGKLTIKPCKPMWFFGVNKLPQKKLTILVPTDMANKFTSINIETTTADIDISALTTNNIDLETVSGNISATRIQADDLSIETVSGNVNGNGNVEDLNYENVNGKLEFTGTALRIDLEAVNGNIKLTMNNTPSEIDSEMVNGNIEIYLPPDAAFGGKFEMINGDFICDFDGMIYKNSFKFGKTDGYDFEAVNGDVEIRINNNVN